MLMLDITILLIWSVLAMVLAGVIGGRESHWLLTATSAIIFVFLTPVVMAIGHSVLVYGL